MNVNTTTVQFDGVDYELALDMWTIHVLDEKFSISIDQLLAQVNVASDLKFAYALFVGADETFEKRYSLREFCKLITADYWINTFQHQLAEVIAKGVPQESPVEVSEAPATTKKRTTKK